MQKPLRLLALIPVCLVTIVAEGRGQDAVRPLTADTIATQSDSVADFVPMPDRWNIKTPPYELNVESHWYDPYNQNTLKGDFPFLGQNTFFVFTGSVESVVEFARVPTPSGVSTLNPVRPSFFGEGERTFLNGNLKISVEIYQGDVAFRPRDWELKATAFFNLNYINTEENNGVNINVRKGDNRRDDHIAFQELSFEKHLFDISDRYDFISLKLGIQRFASDFRGFIFSDFNLGARLFGNAASNRIQYNIIYLPMLEKETNSELNTVFDDREQDVFIANLYWQDMLTLGHTTQFSFHFNHDKPTIHFDNNGFLIRPSVVGNVKPHEFNAYYLGWTGDGHFGELNVTHAFYQVFGTDDFNSFAARPIDLNAQMAALELSIDKDWMRFKVSGFYASGDSEPSDDTGTGFDAIFDQPVFAGGLFSYWNSQRIGLLGVGLVQKLSILPSLRSSKIEGQANFVNPGLLLVNAGYDAEISQSLKATINVNYLRFVDTAVLQMFLNQPAIHKQIGLDYSLGILWRPFLNNNAIVTLGIAGLSPFDGFKDIYETSDIQFSSFGSLGLTF